MDGDRERAFDSLCSLPSTSSGQAGHSTHRTARHSVEWLAMSEKSVSCGEQREGEALRLATLAPSTSSGQAGHSTHPMTRHSVEWLAIAGSVGSTLGGSTECKARGTRGAIRAFQESAKLPVTGEIGDEVIRRLGENPFR